MARISTGQNIGATDRGTSQRLLGGIAMDAAPGALAQRDINAPALQPTAAPVNTFQQTGAPTLGGPIRLFAPPELPQPNQDLANLAKSLGMFSTTLENVSKTYYETYQLQEKQAEQKGAQVAAEAASYGRFTSFGELLKDVEKKAATDPAAATYLQRLKSLDPRTLPYVVTNIQDSAVKFNLATARERINQTRALPDGTPLEEVDPADPRFNQLMTSLILPQDMAVSPRVFQNNQAALYSMYGSLGNDQAKRYGDWKSSQAKNAFQKNVDAQVALLGSGTISFENLAVNLSDGLNQVWANSGLTTQDYQKTKEDLLNNLADSARAYAGGDVGVLSALGGKLLKAAAKMTAGPRGELLLDQVGGQKALADFYRRLMSGVAADRELEQKFEGFIGEDQADSDVAKSMTPQVLADPYAFQQRSEALLRRGQQLFPNDPDRALAYQARVQKQLQNLERGYIQPIQDQQDLNLWSTMATDPRSMSAEQIVDMRERGLISKAAANQALGSLQAMNREDNRANYQTLRQSQADLKERLELQFKRGDSEGGATFTPGEAKQLFTAMGALWRKGDELIKKNPGKDLTQQLGDIYSKAVISGMTPVKKDNKVPAITTDDLMKRLNNLDNNIRLDETTRQQIKRSGLKPSQFFRQQMESQGLKMDPSTEKKLQDLDKSNLVSSTSMGTGGLAMLPVDRYGSLAARLANQFASAVGNALVPPAAAGEMPLAMMNVRGPVDINRLRNAIVGKESGGNFNAVNPDSGAIGIGQVMPENVGPWTERHYGRRLTPSQFKRNKQAQIAVVNGQLNDILRQQLSATRDVPTAIRRTAAVWYSGQANLYNDTKAQGGGKYPSIRDYTNDILRRYSGS